MSESGRRREDLEPADPETPMEKVERALLAKTLRSSLPSLPGPERRVICLRYGLGASDRELTHKEIGALLHIPGAQAQKLEHQALDRLRAQVHFSREGCIA